MGYYCKVEGLDDLFDSLKPFRLQPVGNWHPDKSSDIDIRIDSSGLWFYRGSAINRRRISKLFSTLLRREADGFYLVTPAIKYRIQVDEAPFVAVEMEVRGENDTQNLYFRTNMDDVVLAGKKHPLTVGRDSGPAPCITIRDRLQAKLTRSVHYQLAELAVEQEIPGSGPVAVRYTVRSDGTDMTIG